MTRVFIKLSSLCPPRTSVSPPLCDLGVSVQALFSPRALAFHSAHLQLCLKPKTQAVFLCATSSSETFLANVSPFAVLWFGLLFLPPWFGFYFPVLWFGKPPGRRLGYMWISPLLFLFSQGSHPATLCSFAPENSCLIYFAQFYCL